VLRSMVATAVVTAATIAPAAASPTTYAAALAGLELHPEWGTITAADGVLRRGCHLHSYSYALTPPEGVWALEVFISGPGLEPLAGGAFLDGYDPTTGTGQYTLCKASSPYGTYTIEAKLSIDDGPARHTEGRLPSATFAISKPPHRHHHHHHHHH
jgi:hypothetical protein